MRRLVAAAVGTIGSAMAAEWWLARRAATGRPLLTTVRSRVAVLAGREAAWAVLSDLEGQVRWMLDAKAIRVLTPGPVGVGTRAEADVRIFGLRSTDPVVITAWEPPSTFAIRHLGRFTGEGAIRLEEAGEDRTLVTWEERLVSPILPHLSAIAMWPVLRRVFQADLERFAVLVLDAETETPLNPA